MRAVAPSLIPSPRVVDGNVAYEPRAWVAWDAAAPTVTVQAVGINEHMARVDGSISLRVEAWRVRVRPAIRSLSLA